MILSDAVETFGSMKKAAKALGIPETTFRRRLREERCEIEPLPTGELDIDTLLEHRKKKFAAKKKYEESRKLVPVNVPISGPFGVAFVGDPHVDDDGTDLELLERDANLIRETDGLYGINVGDTTNNWVGRLGRLYSEQSTTQSEAWVLAEWFLGLVPWIAVIGGNHDLWSGAGDPIKWILRKATYEPFMVRLGLKSPDRDEPIIINARHDFKGNSQWNPAHGAMKAAQLGFRDHILVCGHKHVSGYGVLKCPSSGRINHALQIPSYKTYDRYARELGLPDQTISPCPVAIIDPSATREEDLVTIMWSTERAADYLTYLRSRHAELKGQKAPPKRMA